MRVYVVASGREIHYVVSDVNWHHLNLVDELVASDVSDVKFFQALII